MPRMALLARLERHFPPEKCPSKRKTPPVHHFD